MTEPPKDSADATDNEIWMPPPKPHLDDIDLFRALVDRLTPLWDTDEAKQAMRYFFRQLANEI